MGGSYVEGPFINKDYKGAHPRQHIKEVESQLLDELIEIAPNLKVVTIAPEQHNAESLIGKLETHGIRTSLGHSGGACYDETKKAIDAGARIAVHTFNGMRQLHHREPGIVGATLTDDRIYNEVIADMIHLHPAVIDLIIRCKGHDKTCLITDCMRAGGMKDGSYMLGEMEVDVRNNIARTKEGSLAGSTLTLIDAIRNVMSLKIYDLWQVVKMATQVPARILDIDTIQGSIEVGKIADFVIVDDDYKVQMTIIDGGDVTYSKSTYQSLRS